LVGRTGVYRLAGVHVFASYLVRVRTDEARLLPDYLCAFLNASAGRRQVLRFATRGVSQTNVNASNLRRVRIPLPSIECQASLVDRIAQLRQSRSSLIARAHEIRRMASQLANELVGGVS
jgi:restriction endonuclease S subunit